MEGFDFLIFQLYVCIQYFHKKQHVLKYIGGGGGAAAPALLIFLPPH